MKSAAQQFRAYTDCVSSSADNFFTLTVSGTGAAFSGVAPPAANQVGVLRLALGTTATGRGSIASSSQVIMRFGGGAAMFNTSMSFSVLSDATNTYTYRAGFIDSITAESTDGVFFRYTNGVNSGRFQAVTRNNNTETAVDTGTAPTAGTWYDLQINVNATGTSADFLINGSVAATITTTIPTAAGRETGYGVFTLRSVGTAAVNSADHDFIEVTVDFATSR